MITTHRPSITHTALALAAMCAWGLLPAPASAQEEALDCTELALEYFDPDYPYTDQELMVLRSQEVYRALSEMDQCISEQIQEAGSSGAGGGGGGGGGGAGTGTGTGTGTGSNNAQAALSGEGPVASGIEGTNPIEVPAVPTRAPASRTAPADEEIVLGNPPPSTGGNGAPPEQIRKVNNDDAVAAQIRKAAEAETDPVRKQALWDEYYRYTGRSPPQ
jgi:hypothetical protein